MRRATIWWHDAHSCDDDFTQGEIDSRHAPIFDGATGWVVRSDRDGVTLVMRWSPLEYNPKPQPDPYRVSLFIPRKMIQRIEWLEPKA
jgi:hypothetical protein